MLTAKTLVAITGSTKYEDRMASFAERLNTYAPSQTAPHRLAQLLPQVLHESMAFRYVREIWGPTSAQLRYEGRADLGNVQVGDGKRFMGRDLIQCTGRSNYRALTEWVHANLDPDAPDFEETPELLEQPEWLGIAVIWYWATRVSASYVEAGNIEMITRQINGGLNGYTDRLQWFDKSALVLLGYGRDHVRAFQSAAGIDVDGVSGPKTRAAMHEALMALDGVPAADLQPDPSDDDTDALRALLGEIGSDLSGLQSTNDAVREKLETAISLVDGD
ncbi:peptidoglycan-binding protein [uncultured Salipiger sp.]|mgnify:CR=1 FL=1|uniref:peptidoglycan-binding protein n=1 Tax=uncultured Salipiger sp. TaxID=499810 RepID=UPI002598BE53|nr:peptidoglycan-binding protein [uncultured Salipiger sp.]